MDPKRKVGHEESEKPKEADMEMDGDVHQKDSVEGRIRRDARPCA